ncbi:MAG: arylesterase [Oscillospiraceae bacterium]|nr:arylesterase [Oscillospiraceae bacterium]
MNILCYGDSNTYGLTTDWKGRLPRSARWPGRLQMLLGEEHWVVEDGLIGRTCAIPDRHRYGRSAMDFLPVALECHAPLDYLILAFGTNDCKAEKVRTVQEAAQGMENLVRLAQRLAPDTRILIVAAAPLRAQVLTVDPDFDALSVEISAQLWREYQKIAERYGCLFLNAGDAAMTSDADGEHLDEQGHAALAEAVARILTEDMKGRT